MNAIQKYLLLYLFVGVAWSTHAQKIGLLMDSYVIDRWYKDQEFFTERIKQLGGECLVENPNGDAATQLELGKKLIASGVQVLVIVPIDAHKSAEIVVAAKAANIPVVSYDRLIDSKDLNFYISYNNLEVGKLQAQYALSKVPSGNYLLVNGPVSDNNAILFRLGQMEVLKPAVDAGKIKILDDMVLGSWSEMETMMKLEDFFSSGKPKPDAIIAANDAIATGTLQTVPKDMLGKVIVTGQDADLLSLKYIVAGSQAMTIYKPIKPLAYKAADIAMALAKKQHLPEAIKFKNGDAEIPAILLTPVVVDKNNYKETVVKDGQVKLSELQPVKGN
jgi:D-xylose transport system substrate-binding protein